MGQPGNSMAGTRWQGPWEPAAGSAYTGLGPSPAQLREQRPTVIPILVGYMIPTFSEKETQTQRD